MIKIYEMLFITKKKEELKNFALMENLMNFSHLQQKKIRDKK